MPEFKPESVFAHGNQAERAVAKQEQNSNEKRKLARNVVFAMALSMFIHHDNAQIDKESTLPHMVLERMVAKGSIVTDNCEKAFPQEFSEITLLEKNEVVFVTEYDQDGSCRILPVAYGTEAGVQAPEKKEQQILDTKNAVRFVFYHTHPVQNSLPPSLSQEDVVDIKKGNIPPFETSMPSTDDIMTMVNKEMQKAVIAKNTNAPLLQKMTTERVVTGLGIWEFGIVDGADLAVLADESRKLGSLQSSYSLSEISDPNFAADLEAIKAGYSGVALAYAALDAGQKQYSNEALRDFRAGKSKKLATELKERVLLAKNYTAAVEKIGFKITFQLHPKYQKMVDQLEK